MPVPKKPGWFTKLDLLTFGLISLLVIAAALWLTVGGYAHGSAIALCWVTAAAFTFVYVRLMWLRKKFLDGWAWEPSWGLMIQLNGYQPQRSALVQNAGKTIRGWDVYFGQSKARDVALSNVIWVIFDQNLDTQGSQMDNVTPREGFTKQGSFTLHVDYDTPHDPIESTSFAHELGHLLDGHVTGNWDEAAHHALAAKLGLP